MLEKIRKLAKEKGLSISRLEKEAGLSNGSVGKWDKAHPYIGNVAKVAAVLEVSIDELFKE